ncbi:hypothetical protein NDU88_003609 [Pleurodeles waltl]|uniref:Uncharacterized protein n=1 Tax=Pleurodeles waltl TaxID=8319 RepID=A0AAV7MR22_PLEWA|nr:hypothetical protein NDU88_003609 [Pleurodeles waltl]
MAYYAEEDEYYQDETEMPIEHQMKERLIQAHVQVSVNQALIKALKPFTNPLVKFGQRELMGRPPSESQVRQNQSSGVGLAPRARVGPVSSAELFTQMATSVFKDHEYGTGATLDLSEFFPTTTVPCAEASHSSSSHTSDLEQAEAGPKQPTKRKRKRRYTMSESISQNNFLFDPEDIIHPSSTEWDPCMEVAHYVQERLRKRFDKDVRNTLRFECPLPSLLGKVADAPELDPSFPALFKSGTAAAGVGAVLNAGHLTSKYFGLVQSPGRNAIY